MRKPTTTMILALLLALSWIGFLTINAGVAQQRGTERQRWEYASTDKQQIDLHGEEGWEAYAVTVSPNVGSPQYWLKRPK